MHIHKLHNYHIWRPLARICPRNRRPSDCWSLTSTLDRSSYRGVGGASCKGGGGSTMVDGASSRLVLDVSPQEARLHLSAHRFDRLGIFASLVHVSAVTANRRAGLHGVCAHLLCAPFCRGRDSGMSHLLLKRRNLRHHKPVPLSHTVPDAPGSATQSRRDGPSAQPTKASAQRRDVKGYVAGTRRGLPDMAQLRQASLERAVVLGSLEELGIVLKGNTEGLDIGCPTAEAGRTLLHSAAVKADPEVLHLLLRHLVAPTGLCLDVLRYLLQTQQPGVALIFVTAVCHVYMELPAGPPLGIFLKLWQSYPPSLPSARTALSKYRDPDTPSFF